MIKLSNEPYIENSSYENVAVLLPAHNEESVVGKTVRDFLSALPGCTVVVCNNASSDKTAYEAEKSGALVINEKKLGKGNAVRRLLATVDAEVLVIADADTTYDATAAPRMINYLKNEHLDMVTGIRKTSDKRAYRRGHTLGNKIFNQLFCRLFKTNTQDIFSGYRVLTGRFARALPIQATGFEIEAEMTAVATALNLSIGEIFVNYSPRPANSHSKLRTYHDGLRILRTYIRLLRHFYPKRFFGLLAIIFGIISAGLGLPIVIEFLETGLVPRLPTAILSSSLGLIAIIIFMTGLLLESIAKNRIEQRQLMLLIKRAA